MTFKSSLLLFLQFTVFSNAARSPRCDYERAPRPLGPPVPGQDCERRWYYDGRRCREAVLPCVGLGVGNNFINKQDCQLNCEVARHGPWSTPAPGTPGVNPRCFYARAPRIRGPPQPGVDCPDRYWYDGNQCRPGTLPCVGLGIGNNFLNLGSCQLHCESTRPRTPCSGPFDCPAPRVCRRGFCVQRGGRGGHGAGGCVTNRDCSPDEICIRGRCRHGTQPPQPPTGSRFCTSNFQCGPGFECIRGMCSPRGTGHGHGHGHRRGDGRCPPEGCPHSRCDFCHRGQCIHDESAPGCESGGRRRRWDGVCPPAGCPHRCDFCHQGQCIHDESVCGRTNPAPPPTLPPPRRRRWDGVCPPGGCPHRCDFCHQGQCIHDESVCGRTNPAPPPTLPPPRRRRWDGVCPPGGCPHRCDFCHQGQCIHDESVCGRTNPAPPPSPPPPRRRCQHPCERPFGIMCRWDYRLPGCTRRGRPWGFRGGGRRRPFFAQPLADDNK